MPLSHPVTSYPSPSPYPQVHSLVVSFCFTPKLGASSEFHRKQRSALLGNGIWAKLAVWEEEVGQGPPSTRQRYGDIQNYWTETKDLPI